MVPRVILLFLRHHQHLQDSFSLEGGPVPVVAGLPQGKPFFLCSQLCSPHQQRWVTLEREVRGDAPHVRSAEQGFVSRAQGKPSLALLFLIPSDLLCVALFFLR